MQNAETDGSKVAHQLKADIVGGARALRIAMKGIRERGLKDGACIVTPKVVEDRPYSLRRFLDLEGVQGIASPALAQFTGFAAVTDQSICQRKTAMEWLAQQFRLDPEAATTPREFYGVLCAALGLDVEGSLSYIHVSFLTDMVIGWEQEVTNGGLMQQIYRAAGGQDGDRMTFAYFLRLLVGRYLAIDSKVDGDSIWAGCAMDALPVLVVTELPAMSTEGGSDVRGVAYVYCPRLNKFVAVALITDLPMDEISIIYVHPKPDQAGFIGTILDNVLVPGFVPMIVGLDPQDLRAQPGVHQDLANRIKMVREVATVQGNGDALEMLAAIESEARDGQAGLKLAIIDLDRLATDGLTVGGLDHVATPRRREKAMA